MAFPGPKTVITIVHDREVAGDLQHKFINSNFSKQSQIVGLVDLLSDISIGMRPATILTTIDDGTAVTASATVTFTGVGSASDTLIFNGVTFTAVASGATGNQWNVGASATVTATNVAAAINASVTAGIVGVVTATSALGVVTVSAFSPGTIGNAITSAKGVDAGSVMTVSSAKLAGGTQSASSASITYRFGV